MTVEDVEKKVDRYLSNESHQPLLVDVPNSVLYKEIYDHLSVGNNKIVDASYYCPEDRLPIIDKLQNSISNSTQNIILTGLSIFLSLKGEEFLVKELRSLMQLPCDCKLIVITYGCARYLCKLDKRYFDSSRIIIIDGEVQTRPSLHFISEELKEHCKSIVGINRLPRAVEKDGYHTIWIVTKNKRSDFENSLYDIKEFSSNYKIVTSIYPELSIIDEIDGTVEQWDYLLNVLSNAKKNWESYILQVYGGEFNLINCLANFSQYNEFEKWVLFIALRYYGVKDNQYLSHVIQNSNNLDSFIENTFFWILKFEHDDKDFARLYEERKKLIAQMCDNTDKVDSYCKQVNIKKNNAIYYLTDITTKEKETQIDLLSRFNYDDINSILKITYPDLASYLGFYYCGNEYMTSYFQQYKYCKTTNKILPEFLDKVKEQATERSYNSWLQPRTAIVDKIEKENSILFFMDAMGIEFLAYIQNKCFINGLEFYADITRCNLPSITSENKEFVQEFESKGCKVKSNPSLDTLKHEGQHSYNYVNTKIPIHLVKELQIIDELIEELKQIGNEEVAYIIADHGATRLAVINEHENKWSVVEKGLHSGRCCKKTEISEKPPYATEENGYWCLANYDRFQGGRKAAVEVHGGATLEEVAVPIIRVKKKIKQVKCEIETKNIYVSYKKTAKLSIYVEIKDADISVIVNGYRYPAEITATPYLYEVSMSDIKNPGTYKLSIYNQQNLLNNNLEFEVKKEGVSEKKFF